MTTRISRRAIACALLATTALIASPTLGASPAPRFVNIDANGVDLTTGKVQFAFEEGGIGAGEGAVRLQRIFAQDAGWVDNYSGGMFDATVNGVTKTYVQIAGISDVFTKSGMTYTSDNATGSSIVYDSTSHYYVYTAADGTKISFSGTAYDNYQFNCPGAEPTSCYTPHQIIRPNGLTIYLDWESALLCRNLPGEPCAQSAQYNRLIGIRTSAGYSASISYVSNNIGAWPTPNPNWFNRGSVSFSNSGGAPTPLPTITYAYPSSGVIEVTDPAGRPWRLTTDANGRITAIRRPGSAFDNIIYVYGADGTVSSATRDGVTTSYARSVDSTAAIATETTTDPVSGQTVTKSDLHIGRPTSFADELNRVTAYVYDSSGRLTRVTQPEHNYTDFSYDGRGNITTRTDVSKTGPDPATDMVSHASFAACVTSGAGINIAWCNKPQTTTDPKGNVTTYTYDPVHGGIATVSRPADAAGAVPQTRYSYAQTNGASGDKVYELTGVSACAAGAAPSCVGTSSETKAAIAWNNNLLPVSVTSGDSTGGLSATVTSAYDARGRLVAVDGPLSGTADTTTYAWDAADQLTQVTDPDPDGPDRVGVTTLKKRSIRLTYRQDGQLSKQELGTVDDSGAFSGKQTLDIGFDSNSRPVTQLLSSGGTTYAYTHRSYDALGRVDCTAVRMNAATWNSLPGACTVATPVGSDGPDRITKLIHDAAGEVTQVQVGVGTGNPADQATERALNYTANGLVASLIDGEGNKTSYVYDGFDRLSETEYPDLTKGTGISDPNDYEQLSYDRNSNVTQFRTRSGGTVAFGYDALDRIISKTAASLPEVEYVYDLLDRPLSAKFAGTGEGITNGFDALGRLVSSSTDVGGTAHVLSYGYDLAARRTHVGWWDGFAADYDRLVTGEIKEARENSAAHGPRLLADYAYDDLRRLTGITRGNGTSTALTYDSVSRLSSLTHDLAGTADDLTLGDSYNDASQIKSTIRSNDAYAFAGLANGSTSYNSNGLNQLTSAGTATLGYDKNGNLSSDGTLTFSYDLENKLTSVTNGSTTVANLGYDPLGRLDTYDAGTPRRFIYDGAEVAAELDESDNVAARYVRGDAPDEILAMYTSADADSHIWPHQDERGSVVAISGWAGTALVKNVYDEYGVPQAANYGAFQYTGQMWLPEIGKYNYKARVYSPGLGRFMQTDPIGYVGDANLYAYVGNDPGNFADPFGTQSGPSTTPIVVTGCRHGTLTHLDSGDACVTYFAGGVVFTPPTIERGGGGGAGKGHHYTTKTEVCARSMTSSEMAELLRKFAVPGHANEALSDGSFWAWWGPAPGGVVTTTFSRGGLRVTNVTTRFHVFSGQVQRDIGISNGSTIIQSIGTGSAQVNNFINWDPVGQALDAFNEFSGPEIFSQLDVQAKVYAKANFKGC